MTIYCQALLYLVNQSIFSHNISRIQQYLNLVFSEHTSTFSSQTIKRQKIYHSRIVATEKQLVQWYCCWKCSVNQTVEVVALSLKTSWSWETNPFSKVLIIFLNLFKAHYRISSFPYRSYAVDSTKITFHFYRRGKQEMQTGNFCQEEKKITRLMVKWYWFKQLFYSDKQIIKMVHNYFSTSNFNKITFYTCVNHASSSAETQCHQGT